KQLIYACTMDQPHLVKELLNGSPPVNVNYRNGVGFTALHYAAEKDAIECVKLLASASGINPNIQDNVEKETPLHKAIINSSSSDIAYNIAKLLIGAGADPRIVNKNKKRAADLTEHDEDDIRRLLLQATLAIQVKEELAEQKQEEGEASDCSSD
ncbi:hypothetical protein LPJ53_006176, partial [Coemansia erecta]